MKKNIHRPFLIFILLASLLGLFLLFRPFIVEIIIATVLVSAFYSYYEKLTKFLWNKKYLASLIMCLLLLIIIILPLSRLLIYSGKKASVAFSDLHDLVDRIDLWPHSFLENIEEGSFFAEMFKNLIIDTTKNIRDWILSGTTMIMKETSNFIVSLIFIILTMFFFFVDGKKMAKKLIVLSPLPNKYDVALIKKFRQVSRSTLISVFIMALTQGLIGGLGFAIISWPFIFTFIIIALFSLIPYIGSALFYLPAAIYLFINGQIVEGIFVLLWCLVLVNLTEHLIKTYLIREKPEINPIFIIFSILEGISLFGFWGIIVGPLIIALTATIMYIYELEYSSVLDKK